MHSASTRAFRCADPRSRQAGHAVCVHIQHHHLRTAARASTLEGDLWTADITITNGRIDHECHSFITNNKNLSGFKRTGVRARCVHCLSASILAMLASGLSMSRMIDAVQRCVKRSEMRWKREGRMMFICRHDGSVVGVDSKEQMQLLKTQMPFTCRSSTRNA